MARLLLRKLGTGASHGIDFPRELMLLARALISLEATAALVDPDLTSVNLTRELLPDLKGLMLPSGAQLEQLWKDNRFDYLALALELPEMIPHLREAIAGGGQGGPAGAGRSGRAPSPPPLPPLSPSSPPVASALFGDRQ